MSDLIFGKFKVGDKVRLRTKEEGNFSGSYNISNLKENDVGIIENIIGPGSGGTAINKIGKKIFCLTYEMHIKWENKEVENRSYYYTELMLELVSEKEIRKDFYYPNNYVSLFELAKEK